MNEISQVMKEFPLLEEILAKGFALAIVYGGIALLILFIALAYVNGVKKAMNKKTQDLEGNIGEDKADKCTLEKEVNPTMESKDKRILFTGVDLLEFTQKFLGKIIIGFFVILLIMLLIYL